MNEVEQPVEVGDDTPPLADQASKEGWRFGFFKFGKAERQGIDYFNPGLVRRPDGLWLLVRRSEAVTGMLYGRNNIWACKLDDNKQPLGGPTLKFLDSKADEQFEDPRAVYWNGQVWVNCVNFIWFGNGTWTGAHEMIGVFQDRGNGEINQAAWTPLARRDPRVGTNQGQLNNVEGKHNKNLLFWFIDDKLFCLYKSDPWQLYEFGSSWNDQTEYQSEGVHWNYGTVRGGTPPIKVGDHFWTFFHSSMPWRGRYRRYYMGALAFDAKPPYAPAMWTRKPLLIGSQNDPWQQRKPLVVFPRGALLENNTWLVTMGVNDLKSAWVEIPHIHLEKLLFAAPVLPGLSLLAEQTPAPDQTPISFVEEVQELPPATGPLTALSEPAEPPASPALIEKRRAAARKARAALAKKREAKKGKT